MQKIEEKKAENVEPEGTTTPIVALISCVSNDLEALIMAVQRQYNLPYGLIDMALAPVAGKIKDRAIAELSKDYIGRRNEDGRHGIHTGDTETDAGHSAGQGDASTDM